MEWHIKTDLDILSLDTIITPTIIRVDMKQHALQTAMALYGGGTLDLQTAADQAGVSPDRLRRAVHRAGISRSATGATTERITVTAD